MYVVTWDEQLPGLLLLVRLPLTPVMCSYQCVTVTVGGGAGAGCGAELWTRLTAKGWTKVMPPKRVSGKEVVKWEGGVWEVCVCA